MWLKNKEIILEIFFFLLGLVIIFLGVNFGSPLSFWTGVGASLLSFGAFVRSLKKMYLAHKRARMFEVLETYPLGSGNDNLTDIEWNGKNLFIVGRISGVEGLFRLNNKLEPIPFIQPDEGWFWAVAFNNNFFVLRILQGSKFDILEFDGNRKLLNSPITPKIEEAEHPSFLIYDGKNFWIGFDVANRVYKLSEKFEVINQFNTAHRLLCAAHAKEYLWLSDAHNIYQYDLLFKFIDEFPYPGTTSASCRGLAFDNKYMWSLNNVSKKLRKHYFE